MSDDDLLSLSIKRLFGTGNNKMAPVPLAGVHDSVKQLIADNSKEDFLQAGEILVKFSNNVINNPLEPKYRKIRLANPTVESKLIPVSGAIQCLFEMGFDDSDVIN